MTLYVNLDVKQGTWRPGHPLINDPVYGLNDLPDEDKYQILTEFTEFLSIKMKELLVRRIKIQYRSGSWVPLSDSYQRFKESRGLSPNIWEATSYLVNSITTYKSGSQYVVGIPPHLRYPDGGPNVLLVAKSMEFGTRNMPARPLFGPVVRFMRRHVRRYWELFLSERGDYDSLQL